MGHIAQMHWRGRKDDPAMATLDCALDLGHRGSDGSDGNQALRYEAAAHARPFFNQPVVVGLHARELEVRIFERGKNFPGKSRQHGIKHRVVDTVPVHGLQAAGGNIRRIGYFFPARGRRCAIVQQRADSRAVSQRHYSAVDNPIVGAIRRSLEVRNAIAPFRFG